MRNLRGNLGQTGLRARRRSADPMADYDRLSPDLRAWIAGAVLPWSPRSVARTFQAALNRRGGDRAAALADLAAAEARRLSRATAPGRA